MIPMQLDADRLLEFLLAALLLIAVLISNRLLNELERERERRRVEHEQARISQKIARDERERGDAWRERALHPERAAFYEFLDGAAQDPADEIPEAFRRGWEQER